MSQEAKVVLVSLQRHGGGALDFFALSNALCENKFSHVAVISTRNEFNNCLTDDLYRKILRVETHGAGIASFLWASVLLRPLRLAAAVSRQKPDIVHVINFHPWIVFLYLLRPFRGFEIIYSPQDDPFRPKEAGVRFVFGRAMERWLTKRADMVAPYSDFIAKGLSQRLKKSVTVIPFGIYPRIFGDFNKKFAEQEHLNLLFFGRIEPYKGLDTLIRAFAILKNENADVALTIAGRGEVPNELKKEAENFGIIFLNRWISDDEVRELLRVADVVVAPYREATQSGTVSVAISYSIPLIATRTGSIPDYVIDGFNGFLVDPGDVEMLAARIGQLAGDRNLLRRMSHNQLSVREKFSWNNSAEKAIAIYRVLMRSHDLR